MRALDLFCGAGGASVGLWRAGFEVTGVDINPQPNYPFKFIQADALTFEINIGDYDFIWASPPCQAFTRAQKIMKREHPDLVAPIREKLKKTLAHWAIENVEGAPLIQPIMLCGAMFEGLGVYRHRLIETSWPMHQPRHPEHRAPVAKMGRRPRPDEFMHVVGHFSDVKRAKHAMGIWWMTRDELREAIPPVYSEFVAKEWREAMEASA